MRVKLYLIIDNTMVHSNSNISHQYFFVKSNTSIGYNCKVLQLQIKLNFPRKISEFLLMKSGVSKAEFCVVFYILHIQFPYHAKLIKQICGIVHYLILIQLPDKIMKVHEALYCFI